MSSFYNIRSYFYGNIVPSSYSTLALKRSCKTSQKHTLCFGWQWELHGHLEAGSAGTWPMRYFCTLETKNFEVCPMCLHGSDPFCRSISSILAFSSWYSAEMLVLIIDIEIELEYHDNAPKDFCLMSKYGLVGNTLLYLNNTQLLLRQFHYIDQWVL